MWPWTDFWRRVPCAGGSSWSLGHPGPEEDLAGHPGPGEDPAGHPGPGQDPAGHLGPGEDQAGHPGPGQDQEGLMGKADPFGPLFMTPEQPAASPSVCSAFYPVSTCPSVHLTVCSPSGCLPRLPPGPQFRAQVPAAPADWRAGPGGAQPGWTPECERGPGGG